jgi:hypothetical protein
VVGFFWEQAVGNPDGRLEAAAAEVDRAHEQLKSAGAGYAIALAERERLLAQLAGDGSGGQP